MGKALPDGNDTDAWAKFWGVNVRTIQRWRRDGQPFSNPMAMAHVLRSWTKCARGAKERAIELLVGAGPVEDLPAETVVAGEDEADDDLSGMEVSSPHELRDYYGKLLKRAIGVRDHASADHYQKRFFEADKAIREIEMHAHRLGRVDGEVVTREQFESLIWALVWWLMRGVDIDIKNLAGKLVGLVYREEFEDVLDRFFVSRRIVEPMARATHTSGVQLPKWVVDLVRQAVDDFAEDGSQSFDHYRRKLEMKA